MSSVGESSWAKLKQVLDGKVPVIIASHPRSGTHVTIDFLRRNFPDCRGYKRPFEPLNYLYLSLDGFAEPDPICDLPYAVKVLGRRRFPIIKTHAISPDCTNVAFFGNQKRSLPRRLHELIFRNARTIYVYRDCRNVMRSMKHWMSGFNPLAREPLAEFIRQMPQNDRNRVEQWIQHVESWMRAPQVFSLGYERLLKSPETVAGELREFLGIEPTEPVIIPRPENSLAAHVTRRFSMRPSSTAIWGRRRNESAPPLEPGDAVAILDQAGPLMSELGYVV